MNEPDLLLSSMKPNRRSRGRVAEVENATTALQAELGNGWYSTSAFQFMAGKAAKSALDTADSEEQISLLIAYQLVKLVCSEFGLGAVNKPDHIDRAELMAAVSGKH